MVGAFCWCEEIDEATDGVPKVADGAPGSLPQERLEPGEGVFDGIADGATGRKIAQGRARRLDNLTRALQRKHGLTCLFVAHELSGVRHVLDQIGVMYLGKLVEVDRAEMLCSRSLHPNTRGLIDAAAVTSWLKRRKLKLHPGDAASPVDDRLLN